jgi:signal transduction histidine kinase
MSEAERIVAALLRLEQHRQPLSARADLGALLPLVAEELRLAAGAAGVQIAVRADAFAPPLPLAAESGAPVGPAAAQLPLQWRDQVLADVSIDPPPPPQRALALLLRVAAESLAEVWAAERLRAETEAAARASIALDLHDAGKQVLPAIMLFAERAEHDLPHNPASAVEMLRTIREVAQQGLDDMAFWLGDLRGQGSPETLAHALDRLLGQIARAVPALTLSRTIELAPMPWQVAACLMGMLRGALANVLLHADARSVLVQVAPADGGVRAVVADDGVGLDPQRAIAAPGIGLESIFERTRALGGRASLQPAADGGTRLELWLPLPPQEHGNV